MGGSKCKKKRHLVRWSTIWLLKSKGDSGIKRLLELNKALQALEVHKRAGNFKEERSSKEYLKRCREGQ